MKTWLYVSDVTHYKPIGNTGYWWDEDYADSPLQFAESDEHFFLTPLSRYKKGCDGRFAFEEIPEEVLVEIACMKLRGEL